MRRHLLALLLAVSSPALAGPREDFNAAVSAVQKAPSDAALREKVIALGKKLKPKPVIPKEAEKRMIRGSAAVESAKSPADFKDAAAEFSAATTAAPWWGDAYYNLAVAQDKAGDYDGALRALKLASLASPGNADAEKLSFAVEYRRDKAVAAKKGPDMASLEGDWIDVSPPKTYWKIKVVSGALVVAGNAYESSTGRVEVGDGFWGYYRFYPQAEGFRGVYVQGTQMKPCAGLESPASATLSPDGRQLFVVLNQRYYWGERNGVMDASICVENPRPEHRFTLRKS